MKPEPRGVHKVDFRLSDEDKAKIKRFAAVAEGSPLAFLRVDRHDCLLDTLFKYLRKPLSGRQRRLTTFLKQNLKVSEETLEVVERNLPALLKAVKDAGVNNADKLFVWISVFIVEPYGMAQEPHRDNGGERSYHTVMVPVTNHVGQGDTQFGTKARSKTLDGAKVWDGNVVHYGGANESDLPRIALMVVLSKGDDPNRHGKESCPARTPLK